MRTTSPARAVPTGRGVRGELRQLRRTRQARSWRWQASDLYGTLLTIAVLGGLAAENMVRLLKAGLSTPLGPDPLLAGWLSIAACLVGVGVGLRALLSLGPIVAGPAYRYWLLATPVRRRALLLPRFLAAVATAATLGATVGAVLGAFLPAGPAAGPALLGVGLRALDHLTQAALAAGAGLATAIQVSVTWLDLSILSGVLQERRLRRIGRIRSRPLAGTGWEVLLAADVRRTLRTRGPLINGLALTVVPYAAAALLPAVFVPALAAVLACVVAGLFAGGLRAVARSAGLRRALPITDRALGLVHLVIPLAVAVGWTLGVLPALLPLHPVAVVLIPLGAVLVVYRMGGRPSLQYSAPYVDPVFGLALPVNLVRQLLRGPFLVAVLAAVQILLAT